MARDDAKAKRFSGVRPAAARQAEETEVYGTLGSLLGVLEVMATDETLDAKQRARLDAARLYGDRLQRYVEALVTLAADDLRDGLRVAPCALRPLLEHAVRGALRPLAQKQLTVRWPSRDELDGQRVHLDASRFDRVLTGLLAQFGARLEHGAVLEIAVAERDETAFVSLRGKRFDPSASPSALLLLARALRRLLDLSGGSMAVDPQQTSVTFSLPLAKAREADG